ncbi:hypothetical protein [Roseimicrobium gellanilyticum]|nr:hypothetical protein [Roseimicrobium gellanilyticum]
MTPHHDKVFAASPLRDAQQAALGKAAAGCTQSKAFGAGLFRVWFASFA